MPIDPSIPLAARPTVPVQSPIEALSQVLQIRNAQQQQQAGALQLEEKKRQMAGEQLLDAAVANSLTKRPDGTFAPDTDKIRTMLAQGGGGHLLPGLEKSWAERDKAQAEVVQLRQKMAAAEADDIGSLAARGLSVLDHGGTPDDAAASIVPDIAAHSQNQVIERGTAAGIMGELDRARQDPKALRNLFEEWQRKSQEQRKLGSEEATSAARTTEAGVATERLAAQKPGMEAEAGIKNQELAGMQGGISAKDRAEMALRAREISIQNSRLALAQNKAAEPNQGAKSQDTSDVKETIKGMKDGTLPPILPGRATKDYTALLAEAHRQGYDLSGAATDWMATQKHLASMNSQTQLKLNQAVNQLPELLDSVDDLAKKWHGGNFPLLNKANLALAKNGAYGSQVASVANQLDAQIADVTADLGNVYMGGNSPTDQALGLAAKSLNSTWDEKVLHDMINMARKNVQIRKNSINNTGVAGVGADNPYEPKPSGSSGVKVLSIVPVK